MKTLKPKLEFVNGNAVLKYEAVSTTEQINGCEYYKENIEKDKALETEQGELEVKLNELKMARLQIKKENLELENNGFCPIDYEQKKLVGALTKVEITHRPTCRHRG